jgi:dTDP-4-dehydrorhamnose reductase
MLLILGAGGMLGHQLWLGLGERLAVTGALRTDHPGLRTLEDQRRRLVTGFDAACQESVARLLDQVDPSCVINAVGVIKQLPEGDDPVTCIRLNSLFPHELHTLCRSRGVRLIHISTDCVFSGARGGYREEDPPDALDLYGRSKALGEVTGEGAVTLRTSIIGHELKHRLSLLEWFLAQSGEVTGYAGVRWNGVTTVELSRVIEEIVLPRPELTGLYQVAADALGKDELLRRIAGAYGLSTRVQSKPDPRNDKTLDGTWFREATGWQAPPWEQMLTDMHEQWRLHAALYS